MAYCTPEEMAALFERQDLVEATNLRDQAASEINPAKLAAAIDGATGIINGYLMQAFSLPIANISPELQSTLRIHACNLARNLLDGSNEEIRKKAEDAISWLGSFVQSTKASGGDTIPGTSARERFGSVKSEPGRQFWTEDKVWEVFG
ncbi:MAG: DUF1320 domain-containing protein [Kovacikia sp.]